MGRKKGSKNRVNRVKDIGKDKVIRVEKVKKEKHVKKEGNAPVEIDMSKVKTLKYMGNCNKCNMLITTKDKISSTEYRCPSCDRVLKIDLLKQMKKVEISKSEFLTSTINVDYHDMPPLQNNDVIELKIVQ